MTRNIILSSCAIIIAGIFFVINDAIINFLSSINIQFYHFIFYGTPAFIVFPIYLIFTGQFRDKMRSTNYWIPLIRGIIFCPISEAIQNYPDLVKKYLGSVIPTSDHFFATLNSAVFTD